jgi:hypothetical protein
MPVEGEAHLAEFTESLARLVAGMESHFLPLGADLDGVVRDVERLTRVAEDGLLGMRQALAQGTFSDTPARANEAVHVLTAQLNELTARMAPLQRVADDLRQLRALGSEVDRIAVILKACRCGFAVETARTVENQRAFAAFVNDLAQLSEMLDGLALKIDQRSRVALDQLTRGLDGVKRDLKGLERLAATTQRVFTAAASEIERLTGAARRAVEQIEEHRKSIGDQTREIVYYLQFGDLIRQKCEHVLSAMHDARTEIALLNQGDASAAATLRLIVQTEAAQLGLIHIEVAEAQSRLSAGYQALSGELESLARCGRELQNDGGLDANQDSTWTRLKLCFVDLQRIQIQAQQLGSHANQSAANAGEAAAALHRELSGVRQVSGRLHVLALNALVLTARLTHRERTLEALGKQVDSLHEACDAVVQQVDTVLQRISSQVGEFTCQGLEPPQVESEGINEIERVQQTVRELLQDILLLAAQGQTKLEPAIARLSQLDQLALEIEAHRSSLKDLLEVLPQANGAAPAGDADDRMTARYTMETERSAHQQVLAQIERESASAHSGLEGRRALTPAADQAAQQDHGLGDNVDLF